jgi:hypothetical protein
MSERTIIMQKVGESTTIRSAVVANDSANPTVASGADCSDCSYAAVEIDMTGSAAGDSFDITPLVLDVAGTAYLPLVREKLTVNFDDIVVGAKQEIFFPCRGTTALNFLCTGRVATATLATIKVRPLTATS